MVTYVLLFLLFTAIIGQLAIGAIIFNNYQHIEREKITISRLKYELDLQNAKDAVLEREFMLQQMKTKWGDNDDPRPIDSADELFNALEKTRSELKREVAA